MFTLIRGIDHFNPQFHDFFYVMLFGTGVSILVCLLWPEDRGNMLREATLDAIKQTKVSVEKLHNLMKVGNYEEVNLEAVKAAKVTLGASLHEANYEISIARIDSASLLAFEKCLPRLLAVIRTFNSSMRRRSWLTKTRRTRFKQDVRLGLSHRHDYTDTNREKMRQSFDKVFTLTLGLLDQAADRLEALCKGHTAPNMDVKKLSQALQEIYGPVNARVKSRTIAGPHELEDAAFTDQLNKTLLDMFGIVRDMASSISVIEERRLGLILPRKMRSFQTPNPDSRLCSHMSGESPSSRPVSRMTGKLSIVRNTDYLYFPAEKSAIKRLWIGVAEKLIVFRRSNHVRYAIKFGIVMGILALPAFISRWYVWFERLRVQWAMISAMVAMETTRGMTFRTAGMKLVGALMGGTSAFIVMEISNKNLPAILVQTAVVGLIIGYLVNHPRFVKAGTVYALAYNIILGVAFIFPHQGTYYYPSPIILLQITESFCPRPFVFRIRSEAFDVTGRVMCRFKCAFNLVSFLQ